MSLNKISLQKLPCIVDHSELSSRFLDPEIPHAYNIEMYAKNYCFKATNYNFLILYELLCVCISLYNLKIFCLLKTAKHWITQHTAIIRISFCISGRSTAFSQKYFWLLIYHFLFQNTLLLLRVTNSLGFK